MRTGKTLFGNFLIVVVASILIAGCEKSGNEPDRFKQDPLLKAEALGAGANYTFVNSFDGGGLLCNKNIDYNTQPLNTPMELWMGVGNEKAGTLVGKVTFLHNPDRVKIDLTDIVPFVVTALHIHFASTVDGIPHTQNGNPIPGQFEYNVPVAPGEFTKEVEVQFEAVGAIHLSVVKYGGIEGFNYYLPDNVKVEIMQNPAPSGTAYWSFKISEGGFISTYNGGLYEGWCVDVDKTIGLGEYPAKLYSSYENLPDELKIAIEGWANLDKVNYLINHFAVGDLIQPMDATCNQLPVSPQELTYGDIQVAIWKLVDNQYNGAGLGLVSEARVNAILCDVNAKGEGFVPGCNQRIVFIVVPQTGTITYQLVIGQPIIGEIEVPCETISGTAWGDGKYGAGFPGAKQWGTYFNTVCPAP